MFVWASVKTFKNTPAKAGNKALLLWHSTAVGTEGNA